MVEGKRGQGRYASPFKDIPWTEVSLGVPEWWGQPLQDILAHGGVYPALDFDYDMQAPLEQIVNDEGSDIQAILAEAEDICKREWLDEYHNSL